MKKLLQTFFFTLFLLLVIVMERVVGLPILFLLGVIWYQVSVSELTRNMFAVFFGLVLATVYTIPFWLGIGLVAASGWGFFRLRVITTSYNRRILFVLFLSNMLIAISLQILPTLFFVSYHTAVLSIITILLYTLQGRKKQVTWKVSRRMEL